MVVDELRHVPTRRDDRSPCGGHVVECAPHQLRTEAASALVGVDHRVREDHDLAVVAVVGRADDLAVDHQFVARSLTVATDFVRHQLLVPRDHDHGYSAALIERAASVRRSGLKVSTMTAVSFVRSSPSERSTLPGCGPCTKPAGW